MKKQVYNVDEDTIEITLNNKEIEKLIQKLDELKDDKLHIHLNFNNNKKQILIHHIKDDLK